MTPAAYVKSLCKRTDYETMIDEVLKTYEPQKNVARERKRFSPETRNILLHELKNAEREAGRGVAPRRD